MPMGGLSSRRTAVEGMDNIFGDEDDDGEDGEDSFPYRRGSSRRGRRNKGRDRGGVVEKKSLGGVIGFLKRLLFG